MPAYQGPKDLVTLRCGDQQREDSRFTHILHSPLSRGLPANWRPY